MNSDLCPHPLSLPPKKRKEKLSLKKLRCACLEKRKQKVIYFRMCPVFRAFALGFLFHGETGFAANRLLFGFKKVSLIKYIRIIHIRVMIFCTKNTAKAHFKI